MLLDLVTRGGGKATGEGWHAEDADMDEDSEDGAEARAARLFVKPPERKAPLFPLVRDVPDDKAGVGGAGAEVPEKKRKYGDDEGGTSDSESKRQRTDDVPVRTFDRPLLTTVEAADASESEPVRRAWDDGAGGSTSGGSDPASSTENTAEVNRDPPPSTHRHETVTQRHPSHRRRCRGSS